MKTVILGGIALACLAIGGVWYSTSGNSSGSDTIIKITQNGASDSDILKAINANKRPLTAEDIILMKKANVSNEVIIKMLDNRSMSASASRK